MTNGILESGQKIVTNGLVMNYDVAQLRSYPATGTVLTDLSGNGNNGTLINGVTFDAGNGGALVFDGVNDYVNLGNSTFGNLANGETAITYSVWINNNFLPVTGVENYASFVFMIQANSALQLDFLGSNIFTGGRSKVSDSFKSTTTPYTSTNTWVNISSVFDYTNKIIAIYINGVLATSVAASFGSNTYVKGTPTLNDRIAANPNGLIPFDGKISQLSLYNRALSADEILQNFNANRLRYGL